VRAYCYGALLEPDPDDGFIVTFPDVPAALTAGQDRAEALANAVDALGVALLGCLEHGEPLPEPRVIADGLVRVCPSAVDAAKIAVIEAWPDSGMTETALAERLRIGEDAVRSILDPRAATKLPALEAALMALGRRLIVGTEAA
jgi:antitoxin HicB